MKRLIWVATCMVPLCVHANDIYTCKGKDGETVFTSRPCPDPKTTIRVSSYTPVPDDPLPVPTPAAETDPGAGNRQPPRPVTAPPPTMPMPQWVERALSPAPTGTGYRNSLWENSQAKRNLNARPEAPRTPGGGYGNNLWNSASRPKAAPISPQQ
jgi:hypothetical protein